MNKKQKGDKAENELKLLLESRGWMVMKSPRTMKFIGNGRFISQANDYWGLFDICCKKDYKTLWIQVKSNLSDVSKVKNEIISFQDDYCYYKCEFCEVWLRVSKKGWVQYFLHIGKWEKNFYDLKLQKCAKFKISGDKK